MISTIVQIQKIERRNRWDFPFYDPKYESTLEEIENSQWKYVALGDLVDFKYGISTSPDYVDEGVLFLRAQNIREYGFDTSEVCYLPSDLPNLERYRLVAGDILITRSGANVGDAAAVPGALAGSIHGSYSIRMRLDTAGVSPYYLATVLNSPIIETQISAAKGRSAQPNINITELSALRVPLPPKHVQDHIAQAMRDAYISQGEKLDQSKSLLKGIDAYVFDVLGLDPEGAKDETRFLKPISEIRGGRFDVDFNMGFHRLDPSAERISKVRCVADIRKETRNPADKPDVSFRYIVISSVNTETGEVDEVQEIMGADAPSRARQVVHTDDIVVSTVRPTRGAIALIPEEMDGFICSTGFTILHPEEGVVPEYLHVALRLSTSLEQFGRRSSGSSYPAILENDVMETLIPLPKREIQERIATEAARRRAKAKRLRADAETVVSEAKTRVERMVLGQEEVQ